MTELPLISCKDPELPTKFVASLCEFGFAALSDHPLDTVLIRRIYDDWRQFFYDGVPAELAFDPVGQDGYYALEAAEHAKGQRQRDFKEYFQFYTWGRCPRALRPALAQYFDGVVSFASELLGFIEANAPAVVRDGFSEPLSTMIRGSEQSMLRVLHYPPVPGGQQVTRAAAHEDINLLTILPAADGPGLEIQRKNGEWLSVPNRPEQVLINIGDMLQEASGGWLPSTTHRVAAPSDEAAARGRMSLPLFLHPRPEVTLSSRYTARRYLAERLRELGVA